MQLYIALSYMQGTVLTAIGYIPSVFLLKNIMLGAEHLKLENAGPLIHPIQL